MKCTLEACPNEFKTCCGSCEAKEVCGDVCPTHKDRGCKYRIATRQEQRKRRANYRWLLDVIVIALLVLSLVWIGNLNIMAEDTLNALSDTRAEIDDLRTEVLPVDNLSGEGEKNDTADTQTPIGAYLGEYTITYYCPCIKCCGKADGITKSGTTAEEGRTVGAEWDILPEGTKIYIEDIGERIVEDTGSGIQGEHLDVFVESHAKALKLGRETRKVYRVE